jgi:unsaturated rhamnogalacturonyl hydrolase
MVVMVAVIVGASGCSGPPATEPASAANALATASGGAPPGFDWGKAVVESTMQRFPTAAALGPWEYSRALFLHGAYLVYTRLRDPRYLTYIANWVDAHVDASGNINNGFNSLDSMMPGNLLLDLYRETGANKYKIAAEKIRKRLDTYPRTVKDGPLGGFWHNVGLHGQLWLDGTFMALPFLVGYGELFGDSTYANEEAARQLIIYGSHLRNQNNGLLYHAYAENGDTSWSDPVTHHSPEFWCRAIGWYGMASIHVLETLPVDHPERPQVLANLQALVDGMANFQDVATGRWFQVVDKGTLASNWLETSCSSMYTFVISRAVELGYVPAARASVAAKGYNGVLQKVSLGSDGLTNIDDICIGTNVGTLSFYLNRPRRSNDFHGIGSFLIMYEQLRKSIPVAP